MTIDGTGRDAFCEGDGNLSGSGFQIDPIRANGVFNATEALAWEVAGPHAKLSASVDVAMGTFYKGETEAIVAEALGGAWNRILGRNLSRAEGTVALMLTAGREALGHLQQAQCEMAVESMTKLDESNVRVLDGK